MSNALSLLDDLEHMFAHPDPAGVTFDTELCLMMADALREVRAEFFASIIDAADKADPGKILRLSPRVVARRPEPALVVPFTDGHEGGAA